MNKAVVNFTVDVLAFAAFVFLAASGCLIEFRLPAGSGHFLQIWGMDRHEWGQIHFWTAIVLVGALLIHLYLHWRWVVTMLKGNSHTATTVRMLLALVCFVVLLGVAVAPFCKQRSINVALIG
jgi:hypothetical protein